MSPYVDRQGKNFCKTDRRDLYLLSHSFVTKVTMTFVKIQNPTLQELKCSNSPSELWGGDLVGDGTYF